VGDSGINCEAAINYLPLKIPKYEWLYYTLTTPNLKNDTSLKTNMEVYKIPTFGFK
jgi:hypothetical protein